MLDGVGHDAFRGRDREERGAWGKHQSKGRGVRVGNRVCERGVCDRVGHDAFRGRDREERGAWGVRERVLGGVLGVRGGNRV